MPRTITPEEQQILDAGPVIDRFAILFPDEVRSTIYTDVMKRQKTVSDITQQPPVERQEIAFILGQILGILNVVPDVPQIPLDELTDSISKFTLKGIDQI